MRRKLVVGNWKMHGSAEVIRQLIPAIQAGLSRASATTVALCPPFVYLAQVRELLRQGAGQDVVVQLGAQDVAEAEQGAFTGDVSAAMLADLGCQLVIVGHSERRTGHGESNQQVAAKAAIALRHGLQPIVCVGETLAERESDATLAVIGAQLDAVIAQFAGDGLDRIVIAYEPVWAIGTGKTASPDEAQAVHAFIRGRLDEAMAGAGERVPLLYGGSVKPDNAAELFGQKDIDGGLVGGASLNADEFTAICRAAES
jgi:triosephosphate isomerase